jgi:PhzF family phenazine biosynthesis protein
MKKFRFKKLDAFAAGSSTGNPAAAIYLDSFDEITENEMQKIARELKGFVCEVGYIAAAGIDRYKLRYFSAEKEVQFCGHATIAILYDLMKGKSSLSGEKLLIETNKGLLDAENRIGTSDAVFITSPSPRYFENPIPAEEIARALNLDIAALRRDVPIGIVNAGNQTLCLPLASLDSLISASPDYHTVKSFCGKNGLDVITIFADDVSQESSSYRTRVFAAPFGYLEDPATGSGNAALGYHLLNNGLWSGGNLSIEQGSDRSNPNIIKLSTKKEHDGMLRVLIGGGAVTRIEGYYII